MRHLTLILLILSVSLSAQEPPVINVIGTGNLVFDMPAVPSAPTSLPEVQAMKFRAYVEDRAPEVVPTKCVGTDKPIVTCSIPLSMLKLVVGQRMKVAITAAVVAADGEGESQRTVAPFVYIRLIGQPAGPLTDSLRVQPAS